jgi:hypothetical protein
MLTTSTNVGLNAETVSWPVRSGEQYRLWVDNFTQRATSFTVQHFVSSTSGTTTAGTRGDEPPAIDFGTSSVPVVEGDGVRVKLGTIAVPK